MKARFAVDFDGTLIEDGHYPLMGPWLPGAQEALRGLQRLGEVVVYTCRTATDDWITGEPRTPGEITHDLREVERVLEAAGLHDIEVWTKPYKPPAAVYIDNHAVRFSGNWDVTMSQVLDALEPVSVRRNNVVEWDPSWLSSVRPDEVSEPVAWYVLGDDPFPTLAAEGPRHPGSERFHEILTELGELHDRKQQDYGRDGDPFANVRGSSEWGVEDWVGAMIRATDKVRRLQTFAEKGELANESVIDAFNDLAVYAVIARVLYEQGLL